MQHGKADPGEGLQSDSSWPGPVDFQHGRVYTPAQSQFLGRLASLKELRAQLERTLGPEAWTTQLVGRGLLATYRECVDFGVGKEAARIVGA
ncbi:MAG: hypothetical protein FJ318_03395 [SAR202 cluster bacterium]|nr:hypothetical protein [SAR202 cluster bacterium]